MLGAARGRTRRRQRDLPEDLIADISRWAPLVGTELACTAFGVPPRTWRHHQQKDRGALPVRPSTATGLPRRSHPAKLSEAEQAQVLKVLCSERFVDVGVAEIYATLLDEGIYLCSDSTMHRILRDHGLAGQRRQRQPGRHHKPRLVATAPNMVWVWDVSRLPGPRKGVWFYLYTIWDLWSRKAVGWTIHDTETAAIAEKLITVTARRQRVKRHQLTIHSDRGAQMTAGTITELYDVLGVRRSLSRPRVSNDNPHAEAGFKTLKYRPDWPTRFTDIDHATTHCDTFFKWYNNEHHHTAIGLLTPNDRHAGNGHTINTARQTVLDAAYRAHPERFPNGHPHPPHQPARVWINPNQIKSK